jgi:hypothetical protein
MIKHYTYEVDMWYISKDEPRISGKLDAGLTLHSKREFDWYDNEKDWEKAL